MNRKDPMYAIMVLDSNEKNSTRYITELSDTHYRTTHEYKPYIFPKSELLGILKKLEANFIYHAIFFNKGSKNLEWSAFEPTPVWYAKLRDDKINEINDTIEELIYNIGVAHISYVLNKRESAKDKRDTLTAEVIRLDNQLHELECAVTKFS